MNKLDLVSALSYQLDLPMRKSKAIVNLVFETMSRAITNGDRVDIRDFGSFVIKKYRDYTGWNPKTGKKIAVGQKKLPFFKVGKELREKVDGGV